MTERQELSSAHERPTGTLTFLFTDIEGSTRRWDLKPRVMSPTLARHDALARAAIESHHGFVFKAIGDAFCAAFANAADALAAALAVQQALRALPASGTPGAAEIALRVRIALHTGAAEWRDGDYFGAALNRVHRLVEVGYGGQVLLSQTTFDLVRDDLQPGLSMLDLGPHQLRDLKRPERVYQLLHPDLPADFPPLKSPRLLPNNLPQQTTSFVGREREIAEVKRLLATTRLLTLTGPGGTGKTRLSLEVANDLLDEYADGTWLIELAALADPVLVPQTVAAVLGLREEPGESLTQTLVEHLRSKVLLLILDNCEHLLTACAVLTEGLLRSCSSVQILATTREGMNIPGEQTYRVPSLAAPDPTDLQPALRGGDLKSAFTQFAAVRLFLDRAASVQPTFAIAENNVLIVAEICHRLDGIPLAIELAAARLRLLSVQQMALRLSDRFRVLTGGSRTALPRQRTLRATIDWSYDLLSEAEQALFRQLAVFAGGFTLEAAEAVTCGTAPMHRERMDACTSGRIERREVLDRLGQLVDKSLMVVDERQEEERFRMLETIRQYGWEKLWESGEGAIIRSRYRDWFLALAEQTLPQLAGRERAVWLRRLVNDYDNLRAALRPAVWGAPAEEAEGEAKEDFLLDPPRLARWGEIVEQLAPVLRQTGRREAARAVLEDYIALCLACGYHQGLARVYTFMGWFLSFNRGWVNADTVRGYYEQAIAVCEAHGLEDWVAYPQSYLAYCLAAAVLEHHRPPSPADLDRAESLARACLPHAEAKGDVVLLRRLYTCLLWTATFRADWDAVKAVFHASLPSGGPFDYLMLENIEETCYRLGAERTFRELCQSMAEAYGDAGLEAPIQHWYLEPTFPQPFPGKPWFREEFDDENWHPALQWQDPTGRSQVDRVTRPGWLGLSPPEGCNIWPVQDFNAPRLTATVQGDFVAQTRVELGQGVCVLAGLLLWRDEQHFVRLELQARPLLRERSTVHLEACVAGDFQVIGRGQCGRQPLWLRVERVGDEVRGLCSADGEQWLACGTVRLPRGQTEQVGVAAIWHGPDSHAWFDTLVLWGGTGHGPSAPEAPPTPPHIPAPP